MNGIIYALDYYEDGYNSLNTNHEINNEIDRYKNGELNCELIIDIHNLIIFPFFLFMEIVSKG